MQQLQITPAKAFQLYDKASVEFKAMLEDTFTKEFFSKKITDRVNTLEDIFIIGGKTLEEIISKDDTKDEAAYKVLKFGINVLNQGKKVDHSDSSQDKYEPRFIYKSGFGLSYCAYAYWFSGTSVGPRLAYLEYDAMLHGIKIMESYYHDYYNL